jgi:hypothetical protein
MQFEPFNSIGSSGVGTAHPTRSAYDVKKSLWIVLLRILF